MKLVFFGYDFSIDIVRRILSDGHDILKIFSFETDQQFAFNNRLSELAVAQGIPFTTERVTASDIKTLISGGCECFFSSGYLHRIPPIDTACAYGINLHPTLLPRGRGPMVMPRLFFDNEEVSGLTIHKLMPEFDAGDILLQKPVKILPEDDIETLSARIAMRAPDMISDVLNNLDEYWENAAPQDETQASYWPAHNDSMRTFDPESGVEAAGKIIRAFSRYGMIAKIQGQKWAVFHAKAWKENHNHTAGDVVVELSKEAVIALSDGYLILKEFYPIIPPNE